MSRLTLDDLPLAGAFAKTATRRYDFSEHPALAENHASWKTTDHAVHAGVGVTAGLGTAAALKGVYLKGRLMAGGLLGASAYGTSRLLGRDNYAARLRVLAKKERGASPQSKKEQAEAAHYLRTHS